MASQERMPTQRQPRPCTRRAYHPSITQHPHKRMQPLRGKHAYSIQGSTLHDLTSPLWTAIHGSGCGG
jgi:hypothetical protein